MRFWTSWDRFGSERYLDEVESELESREPEVFRNGSCGTLIRISGLYTRWDTERVARVRQGLARLVSPFAQFTDFRIALDCPEFPDQSGAITSELLRYAPYRLVGSVDEFGRLWNGSIGAEEADLRQSAAEWFREDGGLRAPFCGPFRLAFFAWDLDLPGLRRASMDRSMRSALRAACGVSLYRDGFRVWPYGEPGDDWLELNRRRVNNPTLRLSTNQLVGIVEITQEGNPELRDRTSREGFIDAPALDDLRVLLLSALSILEERRFVSRQAVTDGIEAADDGDPVLGALHEARSRSLKAAGTSQLLDRAISAYRTTIRDYEARQAHLLRLAALATTAEYIGIEISHAVAAAGLALRIGRNSLVNGEVDRVVARYLQDAERRVDILAEQLEALTPLLTPVDPEHQELLDIRAVVEQAVTVFTDRLRRTGVRISIAQPAPLAVRMARTHLLQVMLHLLDNALNSLSSPPDGSRPEIMLRLLPELPGFIFADSGPGVRAELRSEIFRPFFSGRSGGRGLGLHLVRTILGGYGFSIELLDDPTLLRGANFRIRLSETARLAERSR